MESMHDFRNNGENHLIAGRFADWLTTFVYTISIKSKLCHGVFSHIYAAYFIAHDIKKTVLGM